MDEMINEILRYLFDEYINSGGTGLRSISQITDRYGQDSSQVGHYLVENGLVKNQQFLHDGFRASISMHGINTIRPDYIDENTSRIVSTLGINGNGWTSIMEILDFDPRDFQIAHSFAKLLEDSGIIETQFRHNDVIIKLTFDGMMQYDRGRANFV